MPKACMYFQANNKNTYIMLISFVFHYACKEQSLPEHWNNKCLYMSLHNWNSSSGLLAKAFRNLVLHEIIRNISTIHAQFKEES